MSDKEILTQIGGQYVVEAMQKPPPADTAKDRDYVVAIDAGHVGAVRLQSRTWKARRGKFSHWFWREHRAEPA